MNGDGDPIAAAVAQVAAPYQQATPYLGTSKISSFLYCPRQFYYQYILKVPSASPPSATLGTCVHSVIQHAHRMNWTTANADEAKALILATWAETKQYTTDPDDPETNVAVVTAGDEWLPWYLWWTRMQIDVAVEERWEYPVGDSGVTLTGTIDRIYREAGRLLLSDVKSGRRSLSPADLANDLQLSIYGWAAGEMGLTLDGLEHVVVRKQKTIHTIRTPEYISAVMEQTVLPAAKAIEVATETDTWTCNTASKWGCGFCRFQSVCEVGAGCADAAA